MNERTQALLLLNSIGLSNRTVASVLDRLDDVAFLLTAKEATLREALSDLDGKLADRILEGRKRFRVKKAAAFFSENGIRLTTRFDADYPANLRYIPDAPNLLYYKGELQERDSFAVAVVGARKTTPYGQWAAKYIAGELASLGVVIVSGLALGIDGIAHRAALDVGGRTLAVLGTGINVEYPKANRGIYRRVEEMGTIFSEYPISTPGYPQNFPYRNRIISGLSLGVVVIEAKEKSGTLITAGYSADQGREVFALPGNINSLYSAGTNALIRDGAKIVLEPWDVIEEIEELRELLKREKQEEEVLPNLSEDEGAIYSLLQDSPRSIDELCRLSGRKAEQVSAILTLLEIKGVVVDMGGKYSAP